MELFLFICIGILSIASLIAALENTRVINKLEKENLELKKNNNLLKEINSIITNQDFDYLDFEDFEDGKDNE